jgi:vacuolar-type H+-ATPase subunit B/Vma2
MATINFDDKNTIVSDEKMVITEEQYLMLQMSENDISNNRLMTQSELDKSDLEWLKTK